MSRITTPDNEDKKAPENSGAFSNRPGPFEWIRTARGRFAFVYLLPALLLYAGFVLLPLLQSFRLSTYRFTGLSEKKEFIGLENFQKLFDDKGFYQSLVNNVWLLVFSLGVILVAAMLIAHASQEDSRFGKFLRAVYLFPHVISLVVVAMLWKFIFNPKLGIIQPTLENLGWEVPGIDFTLGILGSPDSALTAVGLSFVWYALGFYIMVLAAGIRSIPEEVKEAAALDGAKGLFRFWRITWPLLWSVRRIVVIHIVIAVMNTFALVRLMTNGGPDGATEVTLSYLYKRGFSPDSFYGEATAIGVVNFVAAMVITGLVVVAFGHDPIESTKSWLQKSFAFLGAKLNALGGWMTKTFKRKTRPVKAKTALRSRSLEQSSRKRWALVMLAALVPTLAALGFSYLPRTYSIDELVNERKSAIGFVSHELKSWPNETTGSEDYAGIIYTLPNDEHLIEFLFAIPAEAGSADNSTRYRRDATPALSEIRFFKARSEIPEADVITQPDTRLPWTVVQILFVVAGISLITFVSLWMQLMPKARAEHVRKGLNYAWLSLFIAGVIFPIAWMGLNSLKTTKEIQQSPWSMPSELGERAAHLGVASEQVFGYIEDIPDSLPSSTSEMQVVADQIRAMTEDPVFEGVGDDAVLIEQGGPLPRIRVYAPELREVQKFVERSRGYARNIDAAIAAVDSGDSSKAASLRNRLDKDIPDLKEDLTEQATLAQGKSKQGSLSNFVEAWTTTNIGKAFSNSLLVSFATIFILIPIAAMAAYVLAKYKFRGSNSIFLLFLGGMMFPQFLVIVPLFLQMASLGLDDNLWGLTIVYIAFSLPFTVFVLTGFFHQLPDELNEAAMLDGCSHARSFWSIMLPLAKPGLVVVTIFDVIGLWNEYNLALVLMRTESRFTLPRALDSLQNTAQYLGDAGALMAAMVIVILPVLIVYWLLKEKIHEAMLAGAVKG